MSKCDEWFKSLIEALSKDPSWDLEITKTTASKPIPDRDKKPKFKQKNKN